MMTRINKPEMEINLSQGTQEGLSEEITHKVMTYLDENKKEVTKHLYTIYGDTITSNVEISDYELQNLKRIIKEIG